MRKQKVEKEEIIKEAITRGWTNRQSELESKRSVITEKKMRKI